MKTKKIKEKKPTKAELKYTQIYNSGIDDGKLFGINQAYLEAKTYMDGTLTLVDYLLGQLEAYKERVNELEAKLSKGKKTR